MSVQEPAFGARLGTRIASWHTAHEELAGNTHLASSSTLFRNTTLVGEAKQQNVPHEAA